MKSYGAGNSQLRFLKKGALFVQTNRMVEVTIPTFNDNQLL